MRGSRPAITVLALTASIALTGCSGSSWRFWESAPPPDHAAPPTPTAQPVERGAVTATPTSSAEAASPPAAEHNGFARRPELTDVHYGPSRVTVVRADVKTLDAVVRWLKEHPTALVMLEGHTDDQGSRDDNLTVGEKRATLVMQYLVSKGIERERISVTSYGFDHPLCKDKTEACRAKNRRVRFLLSQP